MTPVNRAIGIRALGGVVENRTTWTLVIPVKALAAAKSRLTPTVTAPMRLALARAFALDTIEAARAARNVGRIIVVTGEVELGAHLPQRVEVVHETPGAGLASAIELGVEVARSEQDVPVAVLLGDLPAMRPEQLDAALGAAARHPLAFVRDTDGTGTTLATARAGVPLTAAFGGGSAARHAASGFVDLVHAAPDAIAPGVRNDVDTIEALEVVLQTGVGRRTAETVAVLVAGSTPHASAGGLERSIITQRKGTP